MSDRSELKTLIHAYRDQLNELAEEYSKLSSRVDCQDATDSYLHLVAGIGGEFNRAFEGVKAIILPSIEAGMH